MARFEIRFDLTESLAQRRRGIDDELFAIARTRDQLNRHQRYDEHAPAARSRHKSGAGWGHGSRRRRISPSSFMPVGPFASDRPSPRTVVRRRGLFGTRVPPVTSGFADDRSSARGLLSLRRMTR